MKLDFLQEPQIRFLKFIFRFIFTEEGETQTKNHKWIFEKKNGLTSMMVEKVELGATKSVL